MWDKIISFLNAVIFHTLLLGIMLYSVKWEFNKPDKILSIKPEEQIVQARAVDENQWFKTINQLKSDEISYNKTLQAQQRRLAQKRKKLEKTVTKESQSLDWLHHLKVKEQERLVELKQRQQAELEAIEKLKWQKVEQEHLKREAEEQKRQEAYRKKLEKAAKQKKHREEQKRKKEKARLAKEAKAARQAEAERQARIAARRTAQKRQESENKKRTTERERQEKDKLINEVIDKIKQHVKNQWVRPRGYYRGLSCVIEIRLEKGGEVNSAIIQEGSGNWAFDNSALQAVYRSSPFVISDEVFDIFKHFKLTFRPDY